MLWQKRDRRPPIKPDKLEGATPKVPLGTENFFSREKKFSPFPRVLHYPHYPHLTHLLKNGKFFEFFFVEFYGGAGYFVPEGGVYFRGEVWKVFAVNLSKAHPLFPGGFYMEA